MSTVPSPSGELRPSGLGAYLRDRFDTAKAERQLAEQLWIRWLSQYLGRYDVQEISFEDTQQIQKKLPGSRAFIRLTRTKVRATDARVMDLLFPGGGQRNWSIEPTPSPQLSPQVIGQITQELIASNIEAQGQQLAAMDEQSRMLAEAESGILTQHQRVIEMFQSGRIPPGYEPDPATLQTAMMEAAKERAEAMGVEIQDQLVEGKFRDVVKKVVHSGHLYGTGWLKGPLAEQRPFNQWTQNPNGEWTSQRILVRRPYFEYVPVWDLYPSDLDVNSMDDLEGMFQRYVLNRADVRKLERRQGFNAQAIATYLREHPHGNLASQLTHETQLQRLRSEDMGTQNVLQRRRYEVIEYTGYTDARMLEALGVQGLGSEIADFKANIWLLGDRVIKVALFPFDDDSIQTYHRYVFEESDVGLLGVGIAEIMNDPQRMFNAAVRALLDNMGSSAGPIFELNADLIHPDEMYTMREIYPRKVFIRRGRGADAQQPLLRVHQVDTRISEFLSLAEMARNLADEATALPRYSSGNANVGQAATRTASGLSMMLGQANIVLKEPISNYDEGITKPFLRAMYNWNMQFNPREDIKGDYDIKPTGSSSLIAKEVRSERIEQFATNTLNPADLAWIKRGELNRERAKVNDLEAERFVKNDEEFAAEQAAQQQALLAQQQAEAAPDGQPG